MGTRAQVRASFLILQSHQEDMTGLSVIRSPFLSRKPLWKAESVSLLHKRIMEQKPNWCYTH